MLTSDDIDIGRIVYPIAPSLRIRMTTNGTLESTPTTNPASIMNLKEIRARHLRLLQTAGVLRSLDAKGVDREETLFMVVWQDHSEIKGEPFASSHLW